MRSCLRLCHRPPGRTLRVVAEEEIIVLAGFGMVDSHDRRPTCVVYNGCSTPSCTLLFRWLISTLVSPHFPLRASPRCFVRTHCAPPVSATVRVSMVLVCVCFLASYALLIKRTRLAGMLHWRGDIQQQGSRGGWGQ